MAVGGIAVGRGLAAAFVLGAQGVNVGTRFLASEESPINLARKQMIVSAVAEDAVKVGVLNDIMPMPGGYGYGTVLRALRTSFTDTWQGRLMSSFLPQDRARIDL